MAQFQFNPLDVGGAATNFRGIQQANIAAGDAFLGQRGLLSGIQQAGRNFQTAAGGQAFGEGADIIRGALDLTQGAAVPAISTQKVQESRALKAAENIAARQLTNPAAQLAQVQDVLRSAAPSTSGLIGSSLGALTARDLGLTSLQLQQQNLQSAISAGSAATQGRLGIGGLTLRSQQAQEAQRQALLSGRVGIGSRLEDIRSGQEKQSFGLAKYKEEIGLGESGFVNLTSLSEKQRFETAKLAFATRKKKKSKFGKIAKLAGTVIGGAVGGPFGAALGGALGGAVGGVADGGGFAGALGGALEGGIGGAALGATGAFSGFGARGLLGGGGSIRGGLASIGKTFAGPTGQAGGLGSLTPGGGFGGGLFQGGFGRGAGSIPASLAQSSDLSARTIQRQVNDPSFSSLTPGEQLEVLQGLGSIKKVI